MSNLYCCGVVVVVVPILLLLCDDDKQRTFEIAMSAFSEYIFGNHSEAHKKIVVRTSREYALACSCSKIIYEDSEIEEILW